MRRFLPAFISAIVFLTVFPRAQASPFGLCGVEPIAPGIAVGGGNANVNVNIGSCQIESDAIIEVMLLGVATEPVGPIQGTDAASIDAAIAAATGLGAPPSALRFVGLDLISETVEIVQEFVAATINGPAVAGSDYIGSPDDYSTWIAISERDVNITVSQAQVTNRTFAVRVATVPLPATGMLIAIGLAGLFAGRARRRS